VGAIAGPAHGVRGQTLSFSAGFTDPGTQDTHTATWDWGDGSTTSGAVAETNGSGAVNASHVYTASGTYTVTLTVTDKDGGTTSVCKQVIVVAAELQTDAADPTKTALVVGGTTGDDLIQFGPGGNTGDIVVTINGVSLGTFYPTGRIIAFGQAGNDDIQVSGSIANSAWLDGGAGNDHLKGGSGNNVLLGGIGDDTLLGSTGRDLLIGGTGADQIVGGGGDDILIGGATAWDDDETALIDILNVWRSGASYATRVAQLRATFLNSTTVFDDLTVDQLIGSSGMDWFFAGQGDTVAGQNNGEFEG